MSDIFWASKPLILIDRNQITNVWPTSRMHYIEKLNAITRLTIVLTILGYLVHPSTRIIMIGIATILIIVLVQLGYKKTGNKLFEPQNKVVSNLEGFGSAGSGKILSTNAQLTKELGHNFSPTTPQNPMSNVLLTDIQDNPNKKSAPPSFLPEVHSSITSATKKMIESVNKSNPNIDKRIFSGLGENFELDTSMRQFTSNANTRITNDQGAFAQFLYGNMPSCKDGDVMMCGSSNGGSPHQR
jgi:hypothetical protein